MSFWETPSITEIVTLVGILGGVGTLYATMRLRKTTFGLEYIKRYWDIEDRLRSAEAAGDQEGKKLQVERYIRLCEDEYELAELGFVDSRSWPVWHTGIRQLLLGSLSEDSAIILAERNYQFELVRECLRQPDTEHKAWGCPSVRRRGRKLSRRMLSLFEPRRNPATGRLAGRRHPRPFPRKTRE